MPDKWTISANRSNAVYRRRMTVVIKTVMTLPQTHERFFLLMWSAATSLLYKHNLASQATCLMSKYLKLHPRYNGVVPAAVVRFYY